MQSADERMCFGFGKEKSNKFKQMQTANSIAAADRWVEIKVRRSPHDNAAWFALV
jgi:hypothetical protein